MISQLSRLITFALALVVSACSASSGPSPVLRTAPSVRVAVVDRAATGKVAKAPPRRTLSVRRIQIQDPDYVQTVCAGRAPDAVHPFGTMFAHTERELVEIDLKSGAVLQRVTPPADENYQRSVAFDGTHVLLATGGLMRTVLLRVFDARLRMTQELPLREGYFPSVTTGAGLAFVAFVDWGRETTTAMAIDPDTATVLAHRTIEGNLLNQYQGQAQILFHLDRLYMATPGEELHMASLEPRTLRPVAAYKEHLFTRNLHDIPPQFAAATLLPAHDGVIVTLENDALELDPGLRPRRRLPQIPEPHEWSRLAIDPESDAVLTSDGMLAPGPSGPFGQTVKLETGFFNPESPKPSRRDLPVAAFFHGGRGFVVTVHPDVRIYVVEGYAMLAP